MNILVIGNGFDLAHGLPTKYGDFLDFIEYKKVVDGYSEDEFYTKGHDSYIELEDMSKIYYLEYKKYICPEDFEKWCDEQSYEEKKNILENVKIYRLDKNELLYYFDSIKSNKINYDEKLNNKNNPNYIFFIYFSKWISDNKVEKIKFNSFRYKKYKYVYNDNKENKNFEKFDKYINENFWIEHFFKMRSSIGQGWIDFEQEICNYIQDYENGKNKNISQEQLKKDLDNLILAFEIYLKEIVEKIDIQKIYDISELKKVDKLLSFNYTHTFDKLYNKIIDKSYIHGEVRKDFTREFNNIVLGVDEYLPEDMKNSDLKFIYFKKYFQRILKQTGVEYKKWINNPTTNIDQNNLDSKDFYYDYDRKTYVNYINVYFFGHSLDVSDKDILEEIINNKDTKIKIFYMSEEQRANQIINLVKIIGQDNLIKYSYNQNKKIEFIEQEYTEYYTLLKKENIFEEYKFILNLESKIKLNFEINYLEIISNKNLIENLIKTLYDRCNSNEEVAKRYFIDEYFDRDIDYSEDEVNDLSNILNSLCDGKIVSKEDIIVFLEFINTSVYKKWMSML